jgi:hypothetical protein
MRPREPNLRVQGATAGGLSANPANIISYQALPQNVLESRSAASFVCAPWCRGEPFSSKNLCWPKVLDVGSNSHQFGGLHVLPATSPIMLRSKFHGIILRARGSIEATAARAHKSTSVKHALKQACTEKVDHLFCFRHVLMVTVTMRRCLVFLRNFGIVIEGVRS